VGNRRARAAGRTQRYFRAAVIRGWLSAFARAYSRSPEQGISAGDQDTISFKADQTGDFPWFCGLRGHGQSGMWMRFAVTGDAKTPSITINADAEPGRG
jgi:Sulfocyanin (SoxE) domain